MFCANCGKEIGENAKFCPQCGAPAATAAGGVNGLPDIAQGPRIGGTGDYDNLRQMMEKTARTRKRTVRVITVLIFAYAFVVVRGLLLNLGSVLEGQTDLMDFVLMVVVMLLFTCGLLYIGLEVLLPILQGKKAVQAEEYLKYIQVSDSRALMHALAQMECSSVKNAYMDEQGNVCVAGKKSKHIFMTQNGVLAMTSKKSGYKAVLERETIAGCLLKFLVPEAPVNVYENEKSNTRLSRMRMSIAITAVVSGVLMIAIAVGFGGGSRYVDMVRNGYPEIYPDITYGQAFDAFFSDGEWEYFTSDRGEKVVEFNGSCLSGSDRVSVTIQFLVDEDQGTFEVYTAAIDGEIQPELVYSLLLLNIFDSYGSDSGNGRLDLGNNEPAYDEPVYDTPIYDESVYHEPAYHDNLPDASYNQPAGLNIDTVAWESIYEMAGLWSGGDIVLTISIYSDAETYVAYEEVGTCFYGEILGTLCFIGSDGISQYLSCELDQGDSFVLQYWGGEEMTVLETSEGVRSAEGATLYCQEHYIS